MLKLIKAWIFLIVLAACPAHAQFSGAIGTAGFHGGSSSAGNVVSKIVGSNLDHGNNIGSVCPSGGTTQLTNSITIPKGQPVVVSVFGYWSSVDAGITVPTLSGGGTGWTQTGNKDTKNTTTTNWVSVTTFVGVPPANSTGALTITWSGAFGCPGSVSWAVDTFSGASGVINQVATGTTGGTAANALSMVLGALANGSATYGAFAVQGSSTTLTDGTGYQSLANNNSSGIWIGATEYVLPGSNTVNATTNNNADWAGVALEIGAIGGTAVPNVIASGVPIANLPKWCSNVHQFENLITAAQMVSLSKSVGATCVRDSLNWDQVESVSGTYNWSGPGFDTEWSAICTAGLYPLMELTYNNPLYASGIFVPIAAGSNTTAYSNYGVAAVNHYIGGSFCPGGFAVELTNEPNNTSFFSPQWTGSAIATMAQSAGSAIKTAQPSGVVVITGGITPGSQDPTVTAASMTTVTVSAADYWGSHPYNYNESTPTQTLTPAQMPIDLASLTTAFGSQVKPFAITEYNFPLNSLNDGNCTTTLTKNMQGIYLGWAMLNVIYNQIKIFAPYDLVDDNTPCSGSDQYSFGLFTNPGDSPSLSAKPAAVAHASLVGPASGGVGAGAFTGLSTYDIWSFQGQTIKQINIKNSSGVIKKRIIWQDVANASQASPAGSVNWCEDMGSFSSVSAVDLLTNSVSLNVTGTVVCIPTLGQSAGPVIVSIN